MALQVLTAKGMRSMDHMIEELIDCGAARVLEATLRANTRRARQGGGCDHAASSFAQLHRTQVCMEPIMLTSTGAGCLACMHPSCSCRSASILFVAICLTDLLHVVGNSLRHHSWECI